MKIQAKNLILIGAAMVTAAALAAAQGAALRGDPWWYGNVFWPNLFVFILPVILGFGVIELCNRLFLSGEGGVFARKCTWLAFGSRLAFMILAPIAMLLWGYESNRNLKGLIELDAIPDKVYHGVIRTLSSTAQSLEHDSPLKYFTCDVSIADAGEDIKVIRPGMNVRGEVLLDNYDSCFVVPASAVTAKNGDTGLCPGSGSIRGASG